MKENMLRSVNKLRHPRDRRRRRQHRPRPPRHTYDAEALPPADLQSLLRLKGCSATSSQAPDCASLLPGELGVAAWSPRIRAEALDCRAEEGADVLVDCRGPARGTQPVSESLPAGGCVVWHAPLKCWMQGLASSSFW